MIIKLGIALIGLIMLGLTIVRSRTDSPKLAGLAVGMLAGLQFLTPGLYESGGSQPDHEILWSAAVILLCVYLWLEPYRRFAMGAKALRLTQHALWLNLLAGGAFLLARLSGAFLALLPPAGEYAGPGGRLLVWGATAVASLISLPFSVGGAFTAMGVGERLALMIPSLILLITPVVLGTQAIAAAEKSFLLDRRQALRYLLPALLPVINILPLLSLRKHL